MYEITKRKLSTLHVNEKNPRFIKDDAFKKLVKSLQDFPQMMEIRPIVCLEDGGILGGNMRYRAAKELKWKEVPCIVVKDLDEARQAEFIIKDNIEAGEWDYAILNEGWDEELLNEWGIEIKKYEREDIIENRYDNCEFKIEISCIDEISQKNIYEKLTSEGYICRVLTL
jgi:ParB-like chromosome segregation protein Spo0J